MPREWVSELQQQDARRRRTCKDSFWINSAVVTIRLEMVKRKWNVPDTAARNAMSLRGEA